MKKAGFLAIIGGVALAMLVAGCGSTSTDATGGASSTTPGGYNYPTATSTTGGGNTSSDLPIATATANVNGASKTILTTASGLTIYYRTSDSGTNVFVGATWPPVLAGSGMPTSRGSLAGTLAVLNDANGAQVTYNGHPLYTFAGDSKPGDTSGEGLGGIWFVVTPDLAKAASSAAAATATPSGGYGGYNP